MFGRLGAELDKLLGVPARPRIKWGEPAQDAPMIRIDAEAEQSPVDRWRQILDTFVGNPGKISSLDVEHIDQLRNTIAELFLKENSAMLASLALKDLQRTQALFDELTKHASAVSAKIDQSVLPAGRTRQQEDHLEVLYDIRVVMKNLWGAIEVEVQKKKLTQT